MSQPGLSDIRTASYISKTALKATSIILCLMEDTSQ